MNYSPAFIISQYLIDEGICVDPSDSGDWPVFVVLLPDGDEVDDNALACFDTAPLKDGRVMEGENIFHYGVQILIRSDANDYSGGWTKAKEIESAMEELNRTEITIDSGNVFRVDSATDTTGVVAIGQEMENSKRRNLFSCNFLVTMKEI